MKTLKTKFISFFINRAGTLLKGPLSVGVSLLAVQLARIGIELDAETQILWVSGLTVAIMQGVDFLVNGNVSDGVKKIQENLDVPTDAVPGPVTQKAVKTVIKQGGRGV